MPNPNHFASNFQSDPGLVAEVEDLYRTMLTHEAYQAFPLILCGIYLEDIEHSVTSGMCDKDLYVGLYVGRGMGILWTRPLLEDSMREGKRKRDTSRENRRQYPQCKRLHPGS